MFNAKNWNKTMGKKPKAPVWLKNFNFKRDTKGTPQLSKQIRDAAKKYKW